MRRDSPLHVACLIHSSPRSLALASSSTASREMGRRSTHRQPGLLSSSGVGIFLLLLPAVCSSAFQVLGGGGGVRRVRHASRRLAHRDSVLTDRAGVGRRSRWHAHECFGALRCSAGVAAVGEPASGSDVSVRSKKMCSVVLKSRFCRSCRRAQQ